MAVRGPVMQKEGKQTCKNTDGKIKINLHTHTHAAFYPSWIWRFSGSAQGDPRWVLNFTMSVYPRPTLPPPPPPLVVFLPSPPPPLPPGLVLICLGWQRAQLFLSFFFFFTHLRGRPTDLGSDSYGCCGRYFALEIARYLWWDESAFICWRRSPRFGCALVREWGCVCVSYQ